MKKDTFLESHGNCEEAAEDQLLIEPENYLNTLKLKVEMNIGCIILGKIIKNHNIYIYRNIKRFWSIHSVL